MNKNQKGNALFLILIAVALFAALSYAVTQSGSGGGTIDKEQLLLKTSEFVQQGAMIKSHIQRLYVLGDVDQVHFSRSARNIAGTVYPPNSSTTTTGETVGVFNTTEGLTNIPYPPVELYTNWASTNLFSWTLNSHTRLQVNGVDEGTSLGDEFLRVYYLTQAACEQVNKQLTGSTTIPVFTFSGAGRFYQNAVRDGTFASATGMDTIDVGLLPGCSSSGGFNAYFDIIKAN